MEKNYNQPTDSDIKRHEQIRKLTTGQGEDYNTGCFLEEKPKNHYRLLACDLSGQKELDADPKAIQQIEFVGQLKKLDDNRNATDAGNDQSMFVLMSKKKSKTIIFSRKHNSLLRWQILKKEELN